MLQKFADLLYSKVDKKSWPQPIAVTRNGYVQFVGYIYRYEEDNKMYWWVVEIKDGLITAIKRICDY